MIDAMTFALSLEKNKRLIIKHCTYNMYCIYVRQFARIIIEKSKIFGSLPIPSRARSLVRNLNGLVLNGRFIELIFH